VFSEWIVLIFELFYFLLPIFALAHLSSADLRFEVIPNTITHGLTDPRKYTCSAGLPAATPVSLNSFPHTQSPSSTTLIVSPGPAAFLDA